MRGVVELSPQEIERYCRERLPHLLRHSPDSMVLRGPCPVHGGVRHSFAIGLKEGLAYCHSECGRGWNLYQLEQELSGAGFREARDEVWRLAGRNIATDAGRQKPMNNSRRIATTYPYFNHRGEFLYEVVRFEPKSFAQRRRGAEGEWVWNLTGVERVLYRYPQLVNAKKDREVWIVEGEKDVETLEAQGLLATCNSGGAGKWRDQYAHTLRDRDVIIVPDQDVPGFQHAAEIAASLVKQKARVRIARLEPIDNKQAKDVTEYLSNGGTIEQLRASLTDANVTLHPTPSSKPGGAPVIEMPKRTVLDGKAPEPKDDWPAPIDPAAFHGLAGKIVASLDPYTEADPIAILVQLLTVFGNLLGRTAHFKAESDEHYGNLFTVLVGDSAKGRKGTSFSRVRNLAIHADPKWAERNISSGLASGEGLLWHIRDASTEKPTTRTGETIVDEGVKDKRLMVVEPEFARVLQVCEREANTLSAVLRQAWDTGNLSVLTKKLATKVTGGHMSIIGHITRDELKRLLSSTAAANGFANRFLWVAVRRSKMLPEGGEWPVKEWTLWGDEVKHAVERAHALTPINCLDQPDSSDQPGLRLPGTGHNSVLQHPVMKRDAAARELWHQVYPELSKGGKGLAAAITSRAEAQTMRLAMLYALLDAKPEIGVEHLQAALALWSYCQRSVEWLFAEEAESSLSGRLLEVLQKHPEGMTKTQLFALFHNKLAATDLSEALRDLEGFGVIRSERTRASVGRPTERWFAVDENDDQVA
jgi:5S rRNA maturation endonuclease (ribonuclease M5)